MPEDQKPPAEEETPEVIAHSDEEDQPVVAGDCEDFKASGHRPEQMKWSHPGLLNRGPDAASRGIGATESSGRR
jgi:hypothetical protein